MLKLPQIVVDGVDLWTVAAATGLRILVVLALAFIGVQVIDRVTTRWANRFSELPAHHPKRQRASTISALFTSSARYIFYPLALIMVLAEIGIDVAALIATAGIAGVALGFGAQTLVKDFISGIFLLFDDTIHVGDRVRFQNEYGTVEDIGVRLIKVRKFDGELTMIPAGELRVFGNTSIGYVRIIVDVGLAYEQDVQQILPIVKQVTARWMAERREILLEEEPMIQAITAFADSSVNIRVAIQCKPGEQFPAERALRMALKDEFDRRGIEIPFPRRTIYMRQEEAAAPDLALETELS